MRGLVFERVYPWLGGALAGAAYFCFLRHWSLPASITELYSAMINLSGIAVGFLATALSIIFTMTRNRLMRQFQLIGYTKHIVGYFLAAIHSSLLFCVINAACLIFKPAPPAHRGTLAIAAWVTTATLTMLCYYRVVRILAKLFRSPA